MAHSRYFWAIVAEWGQWSGNAKQAQCRGIGLWIQRPEFTNPITSCLATSNGLVFCFPSFPVSPFHSITTFGFTFPHSQLKANCSPLQNEIESPLPDTQKLWKSGITCQARLRAFYIITILFFFFFFAHANLFKFSPVQVGSCLFIRSFICLFIPSFNKQVVIKPGIVLKSLRL